MPSAICTVPVPKHLSVHIYTQNQQLDTHGSELTYTIIIQYTAKNWKLPDEKKRCTFKRKTKLLQLLFSKALCHKKLSVFFVAVFATKNAFEEKHKR